jgi:hypothetical protein
MSDKVNTQHAQYNKWIDLWAKTRDCVEGQDKIKSKGTTYLPDFFQGAVNTEGVSKYDKYKQRSQYDNFTGRTLQIGLGQLFRKAPIVTEADEIYLNNIDLSGSNFDYFSRSLAEEIMQVNRVGVLVDYSVDSRRPFLTEYKAESIIN